MLSMLMQVTWVIVTGDNQNKMQSSCIAFFSPKNTSLVIHGASYYKPDVASVCYVALIYVKGEEL